MRNAKGSLGLMPYLDFGFRDSSFGFLLRHLKLFLFETHVLRSRRLNQKKTKIIFDPRSQKRPLEDNRLGAVQAGKKVTAINIILEILHRLDLIGTEISGVEQRQRHQQHARKAHKTRPHSQVIFGLAEKITAQEL